ncbi:MAG: hypothetical protein HQL46_01470 [Gammaproteobacteria bacterium]|nr:hypothetical protein [Gammaproteobacteria bacterium]
MNKHTDNTGTNLPPVRPFSTLIKINFLQLNQLDESDAELYLNVFIWVLSSRIKLEEQSTN